MGMEPTIGVMFFSTDKKVAHLEENERGRKSGPKGPQKELKTYGLLM